MVHLQAEATVGGGGVLPFVPVQRAMFSALKALSETSGGTVSVPMPELPEGTMQFDLMSLVSRMVSDAGFAAGWTSGAESFTITRIGSRGGEPAAVDLMGDAARDLVELARSAIAAQQELLEQIARSVSPSLWPQAMQAASLLMQVITTIITVVLAVTS